MKLYKKRLLSVVTLIGMFISLLPAIPAAAADRGVTVLCALDDASGWSSNNGATAESVSKPGGGGNAMKLVFTKGADSNQWRNTSKQLFWPPIELDDGAKLFIDVYVTPGSAVKSGLCVNIGGWDDSANTSRTMVDTNLGLLNDGWNTIEISMIAGVRKLFQNLQFYMNRANPAWTEDTAEFIVSNLRSEKEAEPPAEKALYPFTDLVGWSGANSGGLLTNNGTASSIVSAPAPKQGPAMQVVWDGLSGNNWPGAVTAWGFPKIPMKDDAVFLIDIYVPAGGVTGGLFVKLACYDSLGRYCTLIDKQINNLKAGEWNTVEFTLNPVYDQNPGLAYEPGSVDYIDQITLWMNKIPGGAAFIFSNLRMIAEETGDPEPPDPPEPPIGIDETKTVMLNPFDAPALWRGENGVTNVYDQGHMRVTYSKASTARWMNNEWLPSPRLDLRNAKMLAFDIMAEQVASGANEPLMLKIIAPHAGSGLGVYERAVPKLEKDEWTTVTVDITNQFYDINSINFYITTENIPVDFTYHLRNMRLVYDDVPVITAAPASGRVVVGTEVSLEHASGSGGAIYYTTNGSDPHTAGANRRTYSGPIKIESDTTLIMASTGDSYTHIFHYVSAPPCILEMSTANVGNMFFEDESISFNIKGGIYVGGNQNWNPSFSIYDYLGNILYSGELPPVEMSAGTPRDFPAYIPDDILGYGVFEFKVTATGDDGAFIAENTTYFSRMKRPLSREQRKDTIFGVCTHRGSWTGATNTYGQLSDFVKNSGAGYIRDGAGWEWAERNKGELIFAPEVKTYIQTVDADMLFTIAYGNQFYDNKGIPFTDEGVEAYIRYAKLCVEAAYPSGVRYFEIWNEPNVMGHATFNPTRQSAAVYAQMLKATYKALKEDPVFAAQYPDLKIVGVSLAEVAPAYMDEFLKAGGYSYMDAFAVHPYTWPYAPEIGKVANYDFLSFMNELYNMMKPYAGENDVVPFWISEYGWPTQKLGTRGVSEALQAAYLVRENIMALSLPYIEKMCWYDIYDDGLSESDPEHKFGLLRNTNDSVIPFGAKPAYIAQSEMSQLFLGVEYAGSKTDGDTMIYQFKKDDKYIVAAWNVGGSRKAVINAGGNTNIILSDIFGNISSQAVLDGAVSVTLSDIPLYLIGNEKFSVEDVETVTSPLVITEVSPWYDNDNDQWYVRYAVKNTDDVNPHTANVSVSSPASGVRETVTLEANECRVFSAIVGEFTQTLYDIEITVEFETASGAVEYFPFTFPIGFQKIIEATDGINIDAVIDGDEWGGADKFTLERSDQVSFANWGGISDLSGYGYTKWDKTNFYLAMVVTDNIHNQPFAGDDIWKGDSVQFSIDTGRSLGYGFYGYTEIGFALDNDGNIQIGQWSAAKGHEIGDAAAAMICAAARDEETNTTTYECAIPWSVLLPYEINGGILPENGLTKCGFSLLINDNDTGDRRGWIEYMSGIGSTKDPSKYGDLTFVKLSRAPAEPVTLVRVTPAANVEKLKGSQNGLTIIITEEYSDGTTKIISGNFLIDNNTAGTYQVGKYRVYVDTKGNTQIREIYIAG